MDNEKSRKFTRQRVAKSKYETLDKTTQNWWDRLFKIMEEDAAIPEHLRAEVLCDIFPGKILKRIYSLFSLQSQSQSSSSSTSKGTNYSDVGTTRRRTTVMQLNRSVETDDEAVAKRSVGETNPYMNFFKRSDDDAAIWRKPTLGALHLTKKAEIVTERVASDFVKWLRKLAAEETGEGERSMDSDSITKIFHGAFGTNAPREAAKSIRDSAKFTAKSKNACQKMKTESIVEVPKGLDVPQIMKMFEVGMQNEASTSLTVAIKEMPAVTKTVAEIQHLPERYSHTVLQKLIQDDIKESRKGNKKLTAFGRCLPIELRCRRADDNFRRWSEHKPHNEDLATMSTVWGGITSLCSTQRYCEWLSQNPDIKPPRYMVENDMLNPENIKHSMEFW